MNELTKLRLLKAIERISTRSGIVLIGAKTEKSAIALEKEIKDSSAVELVKYNIDKLDNSKIDSLEILKYINYSLEVEKTFIANIFNHKEELNIINHLHFQRDFIGSDGVKIILIMSNNMLNKLQMMGDLFSTVKFSYEEK